MITPSIWHLWDHIWSGVPRFELPSAQKRLSRLSKTRAQDTREKAEKAGFAHAGEGKGETLVLSTSTWQENMEKMETFFLDMHREKTRGNEHKLEHWNSTYILEEIYLSWQRQNILVLNLQQNLNSQVLQNHGLTKHEQGPFQPKLAYVSAVLWWLFLIQ